LLFVYKIGQVTIEALKVKAFVALQTSHEA
jgi:hypothetical protein